MAKRAPAPKKTNLRQFAGGGVINPLDLIDKGESMLDSIGSNSNLSGRQKAGAMLDVGASMARLGIDPGISDRLNGMKSSMGPSRLARTQAAAFGQEVSAAAARPAGVVPASDSPLASLPATSQATTFQQDSDARQQRITGYADKLRGMEEAARKDPNTLHAAYADGGKPESSEELMVRIAAKYGVTAAPRAPVQEPAPKPQPKPQQPAAASGLTARIGSLFESRRKQIDEAAGYAEGGKISGPGTPKSDSIPATVRETGENIMIANKERILSIEQDQFLEGVAKAAGYENLNAMLEDGTGKPVGPTIKAGKRAAAEGMAPDEDDRVTTAIQAPPTLGGAPLARSEPAGTLTPAYRPEINGIQWNGKGFDPLKEDMAPGTGAIAITSGPSAGKNIVVGQQIYTAPDGTPTSTHRGSQENLQGIADAEGIKKQLANIQRMRLETDAFDPTITDPNVRASARAALATADRREERQGLTEGRQLENQLKAHRLSSAGRLDTLQAEYVAEQDPDKREQLAEQIRGLKGYRSTEAGGLTLPQQRSNAEIDAARARITGLTPDEIKRKTANYTATGRENPEYDPALAKAVSLANRRKVGDDQDFDSRQAPETRPAAPQAKFTADDVKAAIAGGADRAKVAERIRSLGGNPAEFGL